jgi:hypothetical protein
MSQEEPPDMPTFELHDRPGLRWTPSEKSALSKELRTFASTCLAPLPDYNCLSSDPSTAFDDKLLVIARSSKTGQIIAFSSAIYLTRIPYLPFVLHTGLTCIAPSHRRVGLTVFLFYHVFTHMIERHPQGFWLCSLAEVPSSLGSISTYATNVYPSPSVPKPSVTHLRIAEAMDEKYRGTMLINPRAVFDKETFVFRGSNEVGSAFRKDVDDPRYAYRDREVNRYYRKLFRKNEGDEVLQVGFVDPGRVAEEKEEARFDGMKSKL